jgi:hypothetical protein
LVCLLRCAATVSDREVCRHLRAFVKSSALTGSSERELQRLAVLALSRSPDKEDVKLIENVLFGMATPDVRMCAAISLATIGGKASADLLAKAEASERYYFVRHWIAAARRISSSVNPTLSP